MKCPACTAGTKVIMVHDEEPFTYHECAECGWDDYELSALSAAEPDNSGAWGYPDEDDDDPAPLSFDEESYDEFEQDR